MSFWISAAPHCKQHKAFAALIGFNHRDVECLGTISYLVHIAVTFCIHVNSDASTHSAELGRPSMNNNPLRRVSSPLAFVARLFHTDIMQRTVVESRHCDDAPSICHFFPGFRDYGLNATRGKLCRQPPHSHSIVSGTCKHLKLGEFY
jgi:hypothetical protein